MGLFSWLKKWYEKEKISFYLKFITKFFDNVVSINFWLMIFIYKYLKEYKFKQKIIKRINFFQSGYIGLIFLSG
jgi:hypothetical protein